ncbi:MAG: transcription termination/antitermination protein NusG [Candidatus Daviesbacteria bacterium]|nr:transcription termination/antitermination protein NusG [Candidatus Daviesbacteria bacterium]
MDDNQIKSDTPEETTVTPAEPIVEENPTETPSENPAEEIIEPAVTEEISDKSENQLTSEPVDQKEETTESAESTDEPISSDLSESEQPTDVAETPQVDVPGAHWYVVHTYSGHENRVAAALKQRVESEHLEGKILDVLVPTQEKIEIRSGKKENVKEKIFPGYILVRMVLDDLSWLAVRTTQGVTSFVGMSNKPTAIPDREVKSIVSYMTQGAQPTYKTTFSENDTVKIIDGPFAEFIGKVESVDKERGKIKVLVSIFGRETPVELDFLQVAKL